MKLLSGLSSLGVLVMLTACTVPQSPAPTALREVRLITFPGGFNWPIWVAAEKGFFSKNGLAAVVTPTPNSRVQMTGLIEGKFDIAMTAIDNVIAYREGQAGLAVDGSDLVAVMGGDNGFLKLVAREDVRSVNDLRGKEIAVDSLTTGYAFVLMEILDQNGLVLDRDYRTVAAGGGLERYEAMLARKHAETLLISPFDVMATARGLNQLTDASAAFGSYQGLVASVRRSWARDNSGKLVGYIRGYRSALDWLYDPANREEALAIFIRNVPNSTRQSAEISYAVLLDPKTGFQRSAAIDTAGVQTVLRLRAKYGKPQKTLAGPESYYDLQYFTQAARN